MDEAQWERLRQEFERDRVSPAEAEAVLDDLARALIQGRREMDALQREDVEEALLRVLEEELPEDPKDRVAIAAILVAKLDQRWWFEKG